MYKNDRKMVFYYFGAVSRTFWNIIQNLEKLLDCGFDCQELMFLG